MSEADLPASTVTLGPMSEVCPQRPSFRELPGHAFVRSHFQLAGASSSLAFLISPRLWFTRISAPGRRWTAPYRLSALSVTDSLNKRRMS